MDVETQRIFPTSFTGTPFHEHDSRIAVHTQRLIMTCLVPARTLSLLLYHGTVDECRVRDAVEQNGTEEIALGQGAEP